MTSWEHGVMRMMIRIAICDDDAEFAEKLKMLIENGLVHWMLNPLFLFLVTV